MRGFSKRKPTKPNKPTRVAISKAEAARQNGKKGGRPRKPAVAASVSASSTASSTTTPEPQTSEHVTDNPHGLTPKELLFVEHYCGEANFNAPKAYALAGYSTEGSPDSVRGRASRLRSKEIVTAEIERRLAERIQAARGRVMDGTEALERLTVVARGDIGKVLSPDDPLAKLPDEARLTIKAVRPGRYGRTIELYAADHAAEVLAKAAGKFVEKHEVKLTRTLAEVLAEANTIPPEQVPA